jgi:hypothetical protein
VLFILAGSRLVIVLSRFMRFAAFSSLFLHLFPWDCDLLFFTVKNRRLILMRQMEAANDRTRTIYCEAAPNAHRFCPNMEGCPNSGPKSVVAAPADETLKRQFFIHGESPGVAVRAYRPPCACTQIDLKDSSMPGPERMHLLFRKEAAQAFTFDSSNRYVRVSIQRPRPSAMHVASAPLPLTLATDCRLRPQEQYVAADKDGMAQQAVIAVRHGGRRVLLCVHIRPEESPASALRRAAAAAAVPVGDTPGGLLGWTFSWGGRAVRDGASPVLEIHGTTGVALCGRLLGGMQAASGGIRAAAGERAAVLATARQMRGRLAACIISVQGLQGLVNRLGRDLLQADAAGGPKLPLAEGAHGGAVPQGRGHRHSDGVSADAKRTTTVKLDEAADDDELLLRVFKDMDTNGVISREELDKALESWTGSRELVEALQGTVQGAGTGIDFDTFKKMANQVRAREQSKQGEGEGGVRMILKGVVADQHEDNVPLNMQYPA